MYLSVASALGDVPVPLVNSEEFTSPLPSGTDEAVAAAPRRRVRRKAWRMEAAERGIWGRDRDGACWCEDVGEATN
jgi:hypothetical protein